MRTTKNTATFLIQCKDKDNCKTVLSSLGKRYRRNIKAVHKTRPFTSPTTLKSKLHNPNQVKLGTADYIVEVVSDRHTELERIRRRFESELEPSLASLVVA